MFKQIARNVMSTYGQLRNVPGGYNLDPNHYTNRIPLSLPGDRVWQGVQKDNGVTGLMGPMSPWTSRNPFQTSVARTNRIAKDSGNGFAQASMGPATFASLMGIDS